MKVVRAASPPLTCHQYLKEIRVQVYDKYKWKCICKTMNYIEDKRCFFCNDYRPQCQYTKLLLKQQEKLAWIQSEKERIYSLEMDNYQKYSAEKIVKSCLSKIFSQLWDLLPLEIKNLIYRYMNPFLRIKTKTNIPNNRVAIPAQLRYLSIVVEENATLICNVLNSVETFMLFLNCNAQLTVYGKIKAHTIIMKKRSRLFANGITAKYISVHESALWSGSYGDSDCCNIDADIQVRIKQKNTKYYVVRPELRCYYDIPPQL